MSPDPTGALAREHREDLHRAARTWRLARRLPTGRPRRRWWPAVRPAWPRPVPATGLCEG